MCTTKLGQSRSQYYCVLQSLHQSTSQCYCVLQSLHKALPSTTVYYQAWTKHFTVLLFTAKLAQTRSSTTVYYKACTNTFQYYVYYKACTNTFQYYCVLQSLHKHVPVLRVLQSLQDAPFRTLMRVHVHKGCACQSQISHALLRDSSWITALGFPKPAWRALTTTRTSRRRHGARPGTDLGQQSSRKKKCARPSQDVCQLLPCSGNVHFLAAGSMGIDVLNLSLEFWHDIPFCPADPLLIC